MRARYPDCEGIVVRDGIGIRYERYGQGWPAILLLPAWSLVHSRHWKMQVPYLARHFTVVCFDGRGSGGSGRPAETSAYSDAAFALDALAVMDAAGIGRAVLVSVSRGALWALRVCGAAAVRRASGPGAGVGVHRAHRPADAAAGRTPSAALRRGDRRPGRLADLQRPLLEDALPRVRHVLCRAPPHRAALDETDRGRDRMGPGDRWRDADGDGQCPGRQRRGGGPAAGRAAGLPGPGDARHTGRGAQLWRGRRAGRLHGRPAGDAGRLRPFPARP